LPLQRSSSARSDHRRAHRKPSRRASRQQSRLQTGGWTVGILANHIWSVAGADNRADVSSTFLQPFISYTTKDAVSFTLNTESTYDWENEQWSVPINAQVTKIFRFGRLPVSLGGGLRYWAVSPDNGPEDLGFRLLATFLLPK
jgi:hypothetical protein